jgi:serine/threonine-protein kinase
VALVFLAGCLWPASAFAETSPGEKATAEVLFDEGVKLMRNGKFEDACPKLETSQGIDPAVGTLLYLGECYEKLGRAASAWATFREAQSAAEASGQTKRAATAKQRVAKIEKDLAYLTVQVADATRAIEGLRVARNGVDAGVELIGSPVPVDPGSVTIEVSAPGYQPFKVTVGIQPRASQSVVVPALVPLPKPDPEPAAVPPSTAMAAAPAAPVPAPSPASEADKGGGLSSLQVIGLVGAGAGVVTAGIGAFFGMAVAWLSIQGIAAAVSAYLPGLAFTSGMFVQGLMLAVLFGALAGVLPAVQAMRLSIVNALNRH